MINQEDQEKLIKREYNYNEIFRVVKSEDKPKENKPYIVPYNLLDNLSNSELSCNLSKQEKIELNLYLDRYSDAKGYITPSAAGLNLIFALSVLAQNEIMEKGYMKIDEKIIDNARNNRERNGVRIPITLYKITKFLYNSVGTRQLEKAKETIKTLATAEYPVVTYYRIKEYDKRGKLKASKIRGVRRMVHLITIEEPDVIELDLLTNKVNYKKEFNIILDEIFYNQIIEKNVSMAQNFNSQRREIKGFNSFLAIKLYSPICSMIQFKRVAAIKKQSQKKSIKAEDYNSTDIQIYDREEGKVKYTIDQLKILLYHEDESGEPIEIRSNDIKRNMATFIEGLKESKMITDAEFDETKEEYTLYLNLNWAFSNEEEDK